MGDQCLSFPLPGICVNSGAVGHFVLAKACMPNKAGREVPAQARGPAPPDFRRNPDLRKTKWHWAWIPAPWTEGTDLVWPGETGELETPRIEPP